MGLLLSHPTVAAFALSAAIGSGVSIYAQDAAAWPDFRGPKRDGHVTGTLPLKWSEEEGVQWKTAIPGRGWSTPVVCGERLWLSTADDAGHELRALALSLKTGVIEHDLLLFEVEEPQHRNALNSYASPSLVSDGERVYISFGAAGTACLKSATGERVWERQDLVCDHMEGPGSSPLLEGEQLVLLFDGGDVQFVVALDKLTGKTRWKRDRNVDYTGVSAEARKAFSTPIVIERDGRKELVASCARATMGYDLKSGDELWRVEHPGFSMASRPLYSEGVLYFTTGFMKSEWWAASCVPTKKDAPEQSTDERVLWRYRRGAPTMPSAILHEGFLFASDDRGTIACLNATTGEERWRERLLGSVCASALLAGNQLLFCDREGKSIVMEATPEPKVLAENHLDAGCYASPILLGNALFLRTATHLYRIGG